MKIGDLVKHLPSGSKAPALIKIYEDWGHDPDFDVGIIVERQDTFASVLPCGLLSKPSWYKLEELELISESR